MAIRTNIGRVDRRLRRLSANVSEFVLDVQRAIIDEVGLEVVRRTPVDTGFARGNWVPGINAAPFIAVSTLDPTAQAAPSRISALAEFLRIGDRFFISNNATYIELLNRGYSPQAAAGFVQRAISTGVTNGIAKARTLRIRR